MRLEYFKYLKMIDQSHSITAAANALFISQQALSKAIKLFEEELHCQLVIRTKQGAQLTKDGEYVLSVADRVLSEIHDMEHHFAMAETSKITGQLKIMSIPFARDVYLSKVLGKFYKYYPSIDLQLFTGEENKMIPALLNREIDLAFLNLLTVNNQPLTKLPEELEFVSFNKFYYRAMMHADSPLAKLDEVSFAQLLEYPIILMPTTDLSDFGPYRILNHFGSANLRLVDSYDLMTQFIADELGVSISSTAAQPSTTSSVPSVFNTAGANIVLRPIKDNVYGNSGYLYNKNHADNPCIQYFLKEFFQQ